MAKARGGTKVQYCITAEASQISQKLPEIISNVFDIDTVETDAIESGQIILAEVLNNIAEHGFVGRVPGRIFIEATRNDFAVRFSIRDTGSPMPGLKLPRASLPATNIPLGDLPEGGFGWFMIRTLAQDLSYRRDGDMNYLEFSVVSSHKR